MTHKQTAKRRKKETMPITRTFWITCDKCGRVDDRRDENATILRGLVKEAGWSISGNRFTCPDCNGRNKTYWGNDEGSEQS